MSTSSSLSDLAAKLYTQPTPEQAATPAAPPPPAEAEQSPLFKAASDLYPAAPAPSPEEPPQNSLQSMAASLYATPPKNLEQESATLQQMKKENTPWYQRAWDWSGKSLWDPHQLGTGGLGFTGTAGKVERGVEGGLEDLVGDVLTPRSLALIVGTWGAGAAAEAAGVGVESVLSSLGISKEAAPIVAKGMKAALAAGFTAQSIAGMVQRYPQINDKFKEGDYEGAIKDMTGFAGDTAFAVLGAREIAGSAVPFMQDMKWIKKPTEAMAEAKKIAGSRNEAIRAGGDQAKGLEDSVREGAINSGIDTEEKHLGGQFWIEANGDKQLLKDWHDALEGSVKPRPETPEEMAGRKRGEEYRDWVKSAGGQGNIVTAYHGTMSPEPITEWLAEPPVKEGPEGTEDVVPSSLDANSFIGPHFAVGPNAPKVADDFAMGNTSWLKFRKALLGEEARPTVYPVNIAIKRMKDFGNEENLQKFVYENHELKGHEELLDEAMRLGPGDNFDPDVLNFEDSDSQAYKETEAALHEWEKHYHEDPEFRGEVNKWIMTSQPGTFGENGEALMRSAASDLGGAAREELQKQGFDGIKYANEVEGGHAVIPIGEDLNKQIRSTPQVQEAREQARQFVYHATDVKRADMIRNNGIKGSVERPGQYANSPEEALRSGAIGVGGRKDLRVFAVPRAEVEAASTPILDDLGRQGQLAGKYLGSKETHMPAHEVELDANGKPTGNIVNLRNPATTAGTLSNERFVAGLTQPQKDRILNALNEAQNFGGTQEDFLNKVKRMYNAMGNDAVNQGIIQQMLENYHPHSFDHPSFNELQQSLQMGKFDANPTAAKHRVFDSLFRGAMAGYNPDVADLATHAGNYKFELESAKANRKFLDDLRHQPASDGMPLSTIKGSGKVLGGETPAMFLNPEARRDIRIPFKTWTDMMQTGKLAQFIKDGKVVELPWPTEVLDKESGEVRKFKNYAWSADNYEPVEHKDARDWKYAATDTGGNPAFMKGEMVVHPEIKDFVSQVMGADRSVIRSSVPGRLALKASAEVKGLKLGISVFHAVQESLRGLMLGIMPTIKEVDYMNPESRALVRNGMTVPQYEASDQFAKGMNKGLRNKLTFGARDEMSQQSRLINATPGLRDVQNYIHDFTFNRLIPSLKDRAGRAKMEELGEMNPGLTLDERARQAASYVNDVFGGQNWEQLGISTTKQDLAKIFLLAPDWLTSEIRSFMRVGGMLGRGEAGSPEMARIAQKDMLKFTAAFYTTARVLNLITSGSAHPEAPFGIVKKSPTGEETVVSLRSLPTDMLHAMSAPMDFVAGRLNPLVTTGEEAVHGRQMGTGRRLDFGSWAQEGINNIVPIASEPLLATPPTGMDKVDQLLKSTAGLSVYKYRTSAEDMAMRKSWDNMPSGPVDPANLKQHNDNLKLEDALRRGTITRADLAKIRTPREIESLVANAKRTPLQARFWRLPLSQAADVWEVALPSERAQLEKEFNKKLANFMATHNAKERAGDPTWEKIQRVAQAQATADVLRNIRKYGGKSGAAAEDVAKPSAEEQNLIEGGDRPAGMLTPGNINLNGRPVVQNDDGTHSSEYSVSMSDDKGHEVLVPTVVDGKFLTPDGKKPPEGSPEEKAMFERAWQHYQETGENLGTFDTPENADAYATKVHNRVQH